MHITLWVVVLSIPVHWRLLLLVQDRSVPSMARYMCISVYTHVMNPIMCLSWLLVNLYTVTCICMYINIVHVHAHVYTLPVVLTKVQTDQRLQSTTVSSEHCMQSTWLFAVCVHYILYTVHVHQGLTMPTCVQCTFTLYVIVSVDMPVQ